ncbi:hypothetical protein BC827DRAFT_1151727 [Russula dissimulans]|nr:hypothetical protein BC827DRAFT_1151727 [Russula dissimulans]
MATVTHYIRSEYDADVDRDRLLLETGQVSDNAVDPDPWQTEPSSAGYHRSHRLANAPKFVPAHLSYDEWGTPSVHTQPTTLTTSELRDGDVATWYRSLSREDARGPGPTEPLAHPKYPSHSNANVKSHQSLEATPEPSSSPSSLLSPHIAPPAASPSPSSATDVRTLSSSAQLSPQRHHRGSRDWFISRAIASQSQSLSTPTLRPGTGSSSGNSLADMLARHPPSAQPFRPPVFLHLGPSNKGWAMLQNQGWSEGEGLGAGAGGGSGSGGSRGDVSATDAQPEESWRTEQKEKARKRTRPSSPLSSQERITEEVEKEEVLVDDDDDDPIIEHDYSSSSSPSPSSIPPPATSDADADAIDPTSTSDPRAAQTALLTPLPTILKSDRLGIGLKAKTESIDSGGGGGAYRTSVKRVTPNAAALAAHLKAAEDMRRTQRQLGKGRRAFARAERIERERRQNMMTYLSGP